jgi:hypothetical protein
MENTDRLLMGVRIYGYDSKFMREYTSLVYQLRYDEVENFFDSWKIPRKMINNFLL